MTKIIKFAFTIMLLQITVFVKAQKTVRYELYIKDTIVDFTGKKKRAIAVNGQIPMPTLTFTEGDTAEIIVHNLLKESTSLHWHGLFLPNKEDGVPYLTQMPIEPNTTFTYKFALIQNGTHWYHSHSGLQEQLGMYGSFVILKKPNDIHFRTGIDDLPTIPIVLSEWTDLKPEIVHRLLTQATDWFAIQKGTTQSYAEAIRGGYFKVKLQNEWKRMNAMDVSDVYYDKFLINGKNISEYPEFKKGDKVRLRVSNGGASTNFWLNYAGGKITVVANDGNDVEPVEVDRLLIAVSETYDIILKIPENESYEFLVTPEDRTKNTSMFFGSGTKKRVPPLPSLKYFEGMKMMNGMMNMDGTLDQMGMQMSLNQMDMNNVMYPEITGAPISHKSHKSNQANKTMQMGMSDNMNPTSEIITLNYAMLRSPFNTTLPAANSTKVLQFNLTGNMNRYVWSINDKVVSETDKILIKKGENVRVILYNGSMMRHPMHLHGHDFRLLNGMGVNAPLKNIVDIMPMETDTIEFNANVEGDWFFHCHILYHMMSGMGRIFSYENQAPNPYLPNKKKALKKLYADDHRFHFMVESDFATNGNDGMLMVQNTRWNFGTEWRLGYHDMHGYESETHFGRYFGSMQWLFVFVGLDWRYRNPENDNGEKNLFGQADTKNKRASLTAGVEYTLPMLVKLQGEVFMDGYFRVQLLREDIPISKRLRSSFYINTDKEYMLGFKYILNRNFGVTAHYDSDMGAGVGITIKN